MGCCGSKESENQYDYAFKRKKNLLDNVDFPQPMIEYDLDKKKNDNVI